jgi:predicted NBD/HSP70 family sugar kinase
MLVNIFNPHEIVFFGELTNCGNYFLDRIKRQISKDSFSMSSEHLSISVSDLPPRAASEGAAHYALEKFFVPIDIAKMALSKQNSIK